MMKVRWLVVLLLGIGCVACGGHENHGTVEAEESEHGLTLNGEKRWEMDAHTRAVLATMDGRSVELGDGVAGDDARRETGSALRADLNQLIAGCTMQGPAHEELHKFLMAYIPAVEDLASSGTPESAARVRELLEIYPVYFK